MDRSIHHNNTSVQEIYELSEIRTDAAEECLMEKNDGQNWVSDQVQFMQQQLAEVPDERSAKPATIFRLPAWYHETNKHLYEPKMVSVGPYHHGKESLRAMEEHKLCSLKKVLDRNKEVDLGVYFRAVRALEARARLCYSESVRKGSREFVTMLLLDACFIIDYFEKLKSPGKVDTNCHVGWASIHLYSDLFLLENQVPFFVIHKLITIRDKRSNCEKPCSVLKLFCEPLKRIFSTTKLTQPEIPCNKIHHLLQLYYESMVPAEENHTTVQMGQQDMVDVKSCSCCSDRFSWDKLHVNSKVASEDHDQGNNISCVSELHEAGISFKKKQKPRDMFDISFQNGILEMPFLKIEDTHKVILWNMAAFEQSQIPSLRLQILSSYLALMDSLINTEKDVATLERSGVVENYLQSNEDAAELFNQFAKSFVLDYSNHYYGHLFREVKKYSNSMWHKNRTRLKHDYFRNPWTTISVLAAAILLVLTAAQTYFSAKSAK